jgi:hypothetical protein
MAYSEASDPQSSFHPQISPFLCLLTLLLLEAAFSFLGLAL